MANHLRAVKFFEIRAKFFPDAQIHCDKADDGRLADAALSVFETLTTHSRHVVTTTFQAYNFFTRLLQVRPPYPPVRL